MQLYDYLAIFEGDMAPPPVLISASDCDMAEHIAVDWVEAGFRVTVVSMAEVKHLREKRPVKWEVVD